MRVLHAVRSDAFAGVERYVARLAEAQSERGDSVLVIGGDSGAMRSETPRHVGHVPAATVVRTTLGDPGSPRAARPDVVHVHMTAAETAGAIALLGTRGAPRRRRGTSVSGQGEQPPCAWRPVGRSTRRRPDRREPVGRRTGRGRSVVIHPGVPVLPSPAPLPHASEVVLVAQRLEPEKHTELAVDAFAESGLADAGWRLEIAGTGRCTTSSRILPCGAG